MKNIVIHTGRFHRLSRLVVNAYLPSAAENRAPRGFARPPDRAMLERG
jgi:hypothetical protein